MYEWRHENIESIKRNGRDANGNQRYVLTLGSGGFTKRVTVAGRYSLTNDLTEEDWGPAYVYMNWDTGRAKYVMFKQPARYYEFRRATVNHVRKAMQDREVPLLANAMDALLNGLDRMEESFNGHLSIDDAYRELYLIVDSEEIMARMHGSRDESMQRTAWALSDYLRDMDKWWHDRLSEYQVEALTTFRGNKLDYRTQGFDWAH